MKTTKTVIVKEFDNKGNLLKHTETTTIEETQYPAYPYNPVDINPNMPYRDYTPYRDYRNPYCITEDLRDSLARIYNQDIIYRKG